MSPLSLLEYHAATRHSLESVRSSGHGLDWPNQPLPFKMYTSLEPRTLPLSFSASQSSALDAIARACAGSDGLPDLQIADKLILSPRTVHAHISSIYSKLSITSRSAATRYAIEHHLT